MNYRITHRTLYEYAQAVTVSHHVARLQPRTVAGQQQQEFALSISPAPAVSATRTDYFGNPVCVFSIQEIHTRLEITGTSLVTVAPTPPRDLAASPPWESVAALFRDPVSPELVEPYQFVFDSPLVRTGQELRDLAGDCFRPGEPLLTAVRRLSARIYSEFQFDPEATTVATPLEEVLGHRRGVCQDFAHLAIAAVRSFGLPARYVSGYLRTQPPEGGEVLIGADYSHAWFSVFCPGLGFVDFDPTNNVLPGEQHVTVAYGRDFSDVSPVAGIVTGGGTHTVKVAVNVSEEQ